MTLIIKDYDTDKNYTNAYSSPFNSPRHRCARHPSLRFAPRGGQKNFPNPLSTAGEERVDRRSLVGVSLRRYTKPIDPTRPTHHLTPILSTPVAQPSVFQYIHHR